MDDHELAFAAPEDDSLVAAAEELELRLSRAREVDDALIAALRCQTEAIREQDRQYGAGLLLEQMRGHVQNLDAHLRHSIFDVVRLPLAAILADASALAGGRSLSQFSSEDIAFQAASANGCLSGSG